MKTETYAQFMDRMGCEAVDSANPWQLFDSQPGWELARNRLNRAMERELLALDQQIASGRSLIDAAALAYDAMMPVLEALGDFGADDSEGHYELAGRINYRLSSRHGYQGPFLERHDLLIHRDTSNLKA